LEWSELQPGLLIGGAILLTVIIAGTIIDFDARWGLPNDSDEDFALDETAIGYQQRNRGFWGYTLLSIPAFILKRIGQFACYGMAVVSMGNQNEIAVFGYLICALILRHTFVTNRARSNIGAVMYSMDRRRRFTTDAAILRALNEREATLDR